MRLVILSRDQRLEGRDWSPTALTMIGMKRLDNLQAYVVDMLARDVPMALPRRFTKWTGRGSIGSGLKRCAAAESAIIRG